METKIAVISIVLENSESAEKINVMLHEFNQYIIGRMGLPYEKKGVHIINVLIDAPQDIISALAGKLGNIKDTSVKTSVTKF